MKRYEIENTTSINNIKTIHNELVKSMDGIGYTNLLRNNYFKTKLRNDDTTTDVIISRWRDETDIAAEKDYNGTEVDGTEFVYLTTTNNENIFGINADNSIYQEFTFSDLERLSNTGVLNLKLFFVKESNDSDDLTISLQMTGAATTWASKTTITPIETSTSTIIAGEFIDTEGDFYDVSDNFVYTQQSVSFNLKDDATYKYSTVGQKFRVVINNPAGSEYKYLMNSIAYFGNSDASSFIKNIDDNSSSISYNETKGEYYLSNDGQDSVYLSANKYIVTVGERATYETLSEATASVTGDDDSYGNERIFYLTSDSSLTGNVRLTQGMTIMGNGNNINCGNYQVGINSDNVKILDTNFNATGSTALEVGLTTTASNITLTNVSFARSGAGATTTPFIRTGYTDDATHRMENSVWTNVSVRGNLMHNLLITLVNGKHNNLQFTTITEFGASTGSLSGSGIYMIGVSATDLAEHNTIKVDKFSLSEEGTATLYGINLDDFCSNNSIEVTEFDES